MKFDELNEDNYLLFAIKFYENPQALTMEDFEHSWKNIGANYHWSFCHPIAPS